MSATSGLLLSGKLSSANILLNGCAIGFVASVDDVLNSAFLPRSEIAKIDQAYAEMDERPVPRAVFTRPPSGWRRVHSGQPVKKRCMCHLIPFRLDEEKATIEQTIERTRFSTTDVDFEAFDEEGAVAPEHAADRAAEMSAAARRDAPGSFAYEYATEVCRGRVEEETGGALMCTGLGNGGLQVPTVRRRFLVVVQPTPDFLYVLKASAVSDRWDEVGPVMRVVADSFTVL